MIARKFRAAALAVCATLGLSACYDGYGYGGVASVGYGYYDGYDYYGSPWYRGWGPGYGWYDGYYYPGSGYYVFDRGGRRHAWSDRQRDYWRNRPTGGDRPAWRGDRGDLTPEARQSRREAWQARRAQRQADPQWQARREAWRAQRQQQGVTAPTQRMERPSRDGDRPAWRGRRGGN